jgi:hypothetical protein
MTTELDRLRRRQIQRVLVGAGVFLAVAAYVAFGMLGVGRPDASGVDLNFLLVAGQTWNAGGDAYLPADRLSAVGAQQARDVYAFAYLPWAHPIASVSRMARESLPADGPAAVQRQWVAAALVVVMPFAAHVSWMGQTSLIGLAAAVAAWHFARTGVAWASGLFLAVAAIKPQMLLLTWIAMVVFLPKRPFVWAAVIALAACVYPAVQAGGPGPLVSHWLQEAAAYRASPLNSPGFQHQTGLESLFAALGVHLPGWVFVLLGVVLMIAACVRWRLRSAEALSVACCLAVLMMPMHDYDLVILAVPIITLCVLLSGAMPFAVFGATLVLLYLPQRVLRGDVAPALLHYRTLLPAVLLVLLIRCVVQSSGRRTAAQKDGAEHVRQAASP